MQNEDYFTPRATLSTPIFPFSRPHSSHSPSTPYVDRSSTTSLPLDVPFHTLSTTNTPSVFPRQQRQRSSPTSSSSGSSSQDSTSPTSPSSSSCPSPILSPQSTPTYPLPTPPILHPPSPSPSSSLPRVPFLNHAPTPPDAYIQVETTPAEYTLNVCLPGFTREGIVLSTRRRRVLHVIADKWDGPGGGGHFERRISFGYDADLAQVRAEFDGEMLKIRIPRRTFAWG